MTFNGRNGTLKTNISLSVLSLYIYSLPRIQYCRIVHALYITIHSAPPSCDSFEMNIRLQHGPHLDCCDSAVFSLGFVVCLVGAPSGGMPFSVNILVASAMMASCCCSASLSEPMWSSFRAPFMHSSANEDDTWCVSLNSSCIFEWFAVEWL